MPFSAFPYILTHRMTSLLPASEARVCFHLLVFVLTVVTPAAWWFVTARIQASPSSRARLMGYQLAIVSLLLML